MKYLMRLFMKNTFLSDYIAEKGILHRQRPNWTVTLKLKNSPTLLVEGSKNRSSIFFWTANFIKNHLGSDYILRQSNSGITFNLEFIVQSFIYKKVDFARTLFFCENPVAFRRLIKCKCKSRFEKLGPVLAWETTL